MQVTDIPLFDFLDENERLYGDVRTHPMYWTGAANLNLDKLSEKEVDVEQLEQMVYESRELVELARKRVTEMVSVAVRTHIRINREDGADEVSDIQVIASQASDAVNNARASLCHMQKSIQYINDATRLLRESVMRLREQQEQ